ncbi:MAG: hypothetical protein [Caudoviricetes sp.]|nr:MAG: hypothetical protein [Caudoviricetes sp.]
MIIRFPEQRLITAMRDHVVKHGGFYNLAFRFTPNAQRMLPEPRLPELAPAVVIPDVVAALALAPRIRVQHLDRLGISYSCASGLHTDAGLSHRQIPEQAQWKAPDRPSGKRTT